MKEVRLYRSLRKMLFIVEIDGYHFTVHFAWKHLNLSITCVTINFKCRMCWYLICLILSQANFWLKREPAVRPVVFQEKWRASFLRSSEWNKKEASSRSLGGAMSESSRHWVKEGRVVSLSLIFCCVLSRPPSVQSVSPGRTRPPWTPPPHTFTHTTHGTPRG